MNLLFRIFNRFRRFSQRLRFAWYRRWFLFTEQPRHRILELGKGVVFYVPVRAEGQGSLRVGDNTTFGFPPAYRLGTGEIMLQTRTPEAEIVIGRDTAFNNNTVLCAVKSIRVGNRCRIGDFVSIIDTDFHEIDPATRDNSVGTIKPVSIGDNVWIGSRAMVLKGAQIGDNSVIAAMSVVTSAIPANCVAAGVPARVIRKLEQKH
jgi:acetyltransferase-like isoleucine patch superfamily enzyme